MTPVRLEPAALRSRVKHSTTEPLRVFNGMQEKRIHYMCENGTEKSVPRDQAFWGQTVILGTEFSIPSSKSQWILIILHRQADDGLFFSDFSNLAPVSFFVICKEIRISSGLYATGPSI